MYKPNTPSTSRTKWLAAFLPLVAAVFLGGATASAQEKTPPPADTNHWDVSANMALALTRGNSDTLLITAGIAAQRKWERDEILLGASGGYGEDNSVKNNEFANAFAQFNHLFSDRFYGGFRVGYQYDGIAGLDYRVRLTPLVGYYFVKTAKTTFAVEVGPALVFEKHEGESEETYGAISFTERLEHKLSDSTKIWEMVNYAPQIDAWTQNYVITAEAGIEAAINKHWSLRVVLQDIYDNQPTPGRKPNDIRLLAGAGFKF